MRHYDDYQTLYNEKDDWYLEFVDKELKKIQRRHKHETNRRTEKTK